MKYDSTKATTLAAASSEIDGGFVSIYTINAFLRRRRPDSILVRVATARASTDRGSTTRSSVEAALHRRDVSNRRFQRSPGLSSLPKT
jgi:hypothetical protein